MDEFDRILLRQYRRDLMPIWEGIGEIGNKVMPAEEAAKGVAGIFTRGEWNVTETHGPEAVALWEMGMGICHAVVELEDLLGIEEDE